MIIFPQKPKVINKKGSQATFEIESLYPGYGITIGNALRRVLLSSLEGAAVTQVKIKGVQHEFSTINGVLEDVIVIMMNLKKMRFKIFSEEPQKATLKIKGLPAGSQGEKKVKGSDFNIPSQIELINKDCHIATLTDKKSELEMEIQIEKGVGYESVERGAKKGKLEIGAIPIDAIFSPVKKVSFRVENMRVGERTDFDKINLEIETDGTISPEEAFFQGADILLKHFSLLSETFKPVEVLVKKEKESEKKEKKEAEKKEKKQKKVKEKTKTAKRK